MTSRQVFRLLVAALGLYFVYLGVADLIGALLQALHLYEDQQPSFGLERYLSVRAVLELAIGFLFISGVLPLENLAFPLPGNSNGGDSDDAPATKT